MHMILRLSSLADFFPHFQSFLFFKIPSIPLWFTNLISEPEDYEKAHKHPCAQNVIVHYSIISPLLNYLAIINHKRQQVLLVLLHLVGDIGVNDWKGYRIFCWQVCQVNDLSLGLGSLCQNDQAAQHQYSTFLHQHFYNIKWLII